MVIISKTRLLQFVSRYPSAAVALNDWYRIAAAASWQHVHEIKASFNHVDAVGNDRYVFNIKGNEFRLVVMIHFDIRTVYIRFVGTHQEYDEIDCSTI